MTVLSSRLYILFVVALLAVATFVRYLDPFFVRALRLIAFDSYQLGTPRSYDPGLPVRIVDIDEQSLSRIGQWPWPRTTMRDLLLGLTSRGAAVVAFDILFAEPDRSSIEEIAKQLPAAQASSVIEAAAGVPTHDQAFAGAIADSASVLATNLTNRGSSGIVAKAGFAIAGDDPRPFVPSFAAASVDEDIWRPGRDRRSVPGAGQANASRARTRSGDGQGSCPPDADLYPGRIAGWQLGPALMSAAKAPGVARRLPAAAMERSRAGARRMSSDRSGAGRVPRHQESPMRKSTPVSDGSRAQMLASGREGNVQRSLGKAPMFEEGGNGLVPGGAKNGFTRDP